MNLSGKRFVVIGGTGLIGSHVVDQLLEIDVASVTILTSHSPYEENIRDPRLRTIHVSLVDYAALRQVLVGVDGVFLLSSLWMGECADNPRAAYEVNVGGTINVLHACHDAGVPRLIYSSSAAVYGNSVIQPITEEHSLLSENIYGASKIAAESLCRAFVRSYRTPSYLALRYTNVYGPRQRAKGNYSSVLVRLIEQIEQGIPPSIHGDGSQTCDFVYVEDVARANLLAMQSSITDEAFNIASGVNTSINSLAELLLNLYGSSLTPQYQTQNSQQRHSGNSFSIEKASRLLDFRARTSFLDGMNRWIEWRAAQKIGQA